MAQPAPARAGRNWLALREPADAAARAADLVDLLLPHLAGSPPLVIHDLGSGTGSMARWLARRLPGPQHWILHDRDTELLAATVAGLWPEAADGSAVTIETRPGDLTVLTADDLAGASLVTAAALLDMLTAPELHRVVRACVGAGCPTLFTISVKGRVDLAPTDPLDEDIAAAFDAHQRRVVADLPLLGPDAVAAAVNSFTEYGAEVVVRASPWRIGTAHPELTGEWLTGWVGAACEQRPDLIYRAGGYLVRRRDQLAAGDLRVTVHHDDLLALPR